MTSVEDHSSVLVTRNTFIDFDVIGDEDHQTAYGRKRSNSLPPSLRLVVMASAIGDDEKDQASDVSTAEPAYHDEEVLSHFSSYPASPKVDFSACGPSGVHRQDISLRSEAKVFVPTMRPSQRKVAALKAEFLEQIVKVQEEIKEALMDTGNATDVEVAASIEGSSIRIIMKPNSLCYAEAMLTTTKTSLLHSTASSTCVYVMGFGARPFTPKPWGFDTVLGPLSTQHHSAACWETYKYGRCSRDGGICRWRHPAFLVNLSVTIEVKSVDGMGGEATIYDAATGYEALPGYDATMGYQSTVSYEAAWPAVSQIPVVYQEATDYGWSEQAPVMIYSQDQCGHRVYYGP